MVSIFKIPNNAVLSLIMAAYVYLLPSIAHAESSNIAMSWAARFSNELIDEYPKPWLMRKSDGKYRWSYTHGLVLKGIESLSSKQSDDRYYAYVKAYADKFIDEDGVINTFTPWEYNIDSINAGKMLFGLYDRTGDKRYKTAMESLRAQLDWHPRTTEGGFWHKLKYPWQLWLDGTYMAGPFYAQYEMQFNGDKAKLDDIVNWYRLAERHTRDAKTGLLYHGWDESKVQPWANKATGRSAHYWSRAMGWFAMALVDTIEIFPDDHPGREEMVAMLRRLFDALIPYQDETGLWHQVTDLGSRKGNYLEASGTSMFVYSIAKAVRLGFVPKNYFPVAERAYQGLLNELVSVNRSGRAELRNICRSAGLGGEPYRDGSYEYYLSEDIVVNDAHGLGSFILASVEMGH